MPEAVAAGIDQPWIDLAAMQAGVSRNAVVAAVLGRLLPALVRFDAEGLTPFLPRYGTHDALAGRGVRVHEAASTWEARALGIADDGALRVRTDDGTERRVHAADVSVRA
jgi:BirA family biotin operon repressor/biotin-[acetyl-CoA-carboxylase] ligase